MGLNVSAWAIRWPLPSIVIMAAIVAIGILGFQRMPIAPMPNIDVPVITVVVTQFGASPSDLETQVSQKIEDSVAGVAGDIDSSEVMTGVRGWSTSYWAGRSFLDSSRRHRRG